MLQKYYIGTGMELNVVTDGEDYLIPGIAEQIERAGIHTADSISVCPTQKIPEKEKQRAVEYAGKLALALRTPCLVNIRFIYYDHEIYLFHASVTQSHSVPFLTKATGISAAAVATRCMLGEKLADMEYGTGLVEPSEYCAVRVPVFSFGQIGGLDTQLGLEMKSTGEAIGYDNKLTRALYKALQSSGMTVANYGTIFLTIADKDKQDALPLVRRFYDLGFNIEATKGTAEFLRQHGIRTRTRRKLSEGSTEIIDSLRQGHVSYVINTIDINQHNTRLDGYEIRRTAVENNVTVFTALETVKVLLDVLEEITFGVSTIDAK